MPRPNLEMTRRLVVWAPMLIVLAVLGCSGDRGELVFGGGTGAVAEDIEELDEPGAVLGVCDALTRSPWVTLNNEIITNTGERSVTISAVTAVNPVGMELVEAALLEIPTPGQDGTTTLQPANGSGRPPRDAEESQAWDARRPAVGETIEPGEEWVLATVFKLDDAVASIDRVRIAYADDGGRSREVLGPIELHVEREC
ncbi:hypothetical protein [Phytoactinopolyspora halotolerans]|uniref:Uncharacterized protein n=1 Tax=Phytoactinopolyspora halotolerans TaxID=1981512 RepID=A0A6L9SH45_9ACTN|nr:hypothetical protein [Phytoactinopolyspora halotolerans]NEE04477.1 hypothetical protein [Phytoactinopolyspora halotolerans]